MIIMWSLGKVRGHLYTKHTFSTHELPERYIYSLTFHRYAIVFKWSWATIVVNSKGCLQISAGACITLGYNLQRCSLVIFYLFQAFESTLKSWEDKQKCDLSRQTSSTLTATSLHPEVLSDEEAAQVSRFGQAAGALIHWWDFARTLWTLSLCDLWHCKSISVQRLFFIY